MEDTRVTVRRSLRVGPIVILALSIGAPLSAAPPEGEIGAQILNDSRVTQTEISSVSEQDKEFIGALAMGGRAQVEMAQLVSPKTGNPAVRRYAQQMIDDHRAAHNGLTRLASAKGIALPVDAGLRYSAMLEELRALSNAQFDKAYLQHAGIDIHMEMKTSLQQASDHAQDAELRDFAAQMLPVIDQHLTLARELSVTREE